MITCDELNKILDYNPETGVFVWKIPVKGSKGKGEKAGTLTRKGYVDVCIKGKKYGLHRLAFVAMTGEVPKCVDHINGIKSDNRWCNLRPATYRENGYNYAGTGSSTGYKNVYVDKRFPGKFFAQLVVEGKPKRLGTFSSAEEASYVAKEARIKYCGEFVNHGSN